MREREQERERAREIERVCMCVLIQGRERREQRGWLVCKQTVADMVYACHNRSGRSYIFPSLASAAPSSLPPFFNLVPSLPLALTLLPSLVLSFLSSSSCHLAPLRFAFPALFFCLLPSLLSFHNLYTVCVCKCLQLE